MAADTKEKSRAYESDYDSYDDISLFSEDSIPESFIDDSSDMSHVTTSTSYTSWSSFSTFSDNNSDRIARAMSAMIENLCQSYSLNEATVTRKKGKFIQISLDKPEEDNDAFDGLCQTFQSSIFENKDHESIISVTSDENQFTVKITFDVLQPAMISRFEKKFQNKLLCLEHHRTKHLVGLYKNISDMQLRVVDEINNILHDLKSTFEDQASQAIKSEVIEILDQSEQLHDFYREFRIRMLARWAGLTVLSSGDVTPSLQNTSKAAKGVNFGIKFIPVVGSAVNASGAFVMQQREIGKSTAVAHQLSLGEHMFVIVDRLALNLVLRYNRQIKKLLNIREQKARNKTKNILKRGATAVGNKAKGALNIQTDLSNAEQLADFAVERIMEGLRNETIEKVEGELYEQMLDFVGSYHDNINKTIDKCVNAALGSKSLDANIKKSDGTTEIRSWNMVDIFSKPGLVFQDPAANKFKYFRHNASGTTDTETYGYRYGTQVQTQGLRRVKSQQNAAMTNNLFGLGIKQSPLLDSLLDLGVQPPKKFKQTSSTIVQNNNSSQTTPVKPSVGGSYGAVTTEIAVINGKQSGVESVTPPQPQNQSTTAAAMISFGPNATTTGCTFDLLQEENVDRTEEKIQAEALNALNEEGRKLVSTLFPSQPDIDPADAPEVTELSQSNQQAMLDHQGKSIKDKYKVKKVKGGRIQERNLVTQEKSKEDDQQISNQLQIG